jgi:pilus assembly protein CpaF
VREALRTRGDRARVGETAGKEANALVKACNSGHDGSITTMHTGPASRLFVRW